MFTNRFSVLAGAFLLAGILLLLVPVVREFHLISASIFALAGSIWAAVSASREIRLTSEPGSGIKNMIKLILLFWIPGLPLLAGALLRGCFSSDGLLFWILVPAPSVILGYAVGRYYSVSRLKSPAAWSLLTLFLIGAGTVLAELILFPQVFFFNHVWGYFPGPLYDDVITVSDSLIYFRYMTLAWALIFWLMPAVYSQKGVRIPLTLCVISLMLCYLNLSKAGIISPENHIQRELGGVVKTSHFEIYYDAGIPVREVLYLADLHEFHYRELTDILDINPKSLTPVRSYVYAHEWQKKKLTGAGATSYVPVWNRNPQMHTHRQVTAAILRHELVHVLAREFSMPVINASPNMAFTEGLAVALESQRNTMATRHEIVAGKEELPDLGFMKKLMNPVGFYSLNASVSYTVAGSFFAWLLDNYPAEDIKKIYRSGRIKEIGGHELPELVEGWHRFLNNLDISREQQMLASRVFALPGLTEIHCPFVGGHAKKTVSEADFLLAAGDTLSAFKKLNQLIQKSRRIPVSVQLKWARSGLISGNAAEVAAGIVELETDDERLHLLKTDALFLSGKYSEADLVLSEMITDSLALARRSNQNERKLLMEILYSHRYLDVQKIPAILIPMYINRTLQQENPDSQLMELQPSVVDLSDPARFGLYIRFINEFILYQKYEAALVWIRELKGTLSGAAKSSILAEKERILRFKKQQLSKIQNE